MSARLVVCGFCRRELATGSLFVNGRGWVACCGECLFQAAPVSIAPQVICERRPGAPPGRG